MTTTSNNYYMSVLERKADFVIHLDLPNLESLLIPSTVKVLRVIGTFEIDVTEYAAMLLKVSVLLQECIQIHSIQFVSCHMVEIAQFVFLASRAKTHNSKLLGIEFQECSIQLGTATSLQFLLKNDMLGKLGFMECSFDNSAGDIIAIGLRANQSLGRFALDWKEDEPPASLMNGIFEMLRTHTSIWRLGLNMTGQSMWDLEDAIALVKTLKVLEISSTIMTLDDLRAMSMACATKKTLNELSFRDCEFSPSGLKLLIDRLSQHVELRKLSFISCRIQPVADLPLEFTWEGLKTYELELPWTILGNFFSKMIDGIVSNEFVKVLDLRGALLTDDDFDKMCDVLLRKNGSPPELCLGDVGHRGQMIVQALGHNTSVKTLMIDEIDANELVAFTEGLGNVHGLRHLEIGNSARSSSRDAYTKEFFEALEDNLQRNTSLWGLSLASIDLNDDMAKPHMPMINYYLAINRVGRNLLTTANIHEGVWPHILAASADEPDGIYFALTSKPDLMAPIRLEYIPTKKSARRCQPRRNHTMKTQPRNGSKRRRTSGR